MAASDKDFKENPLYGSNRVAVRNYPGGPVVVKHINAVCGIEYGKVKFAKGKTRYYQIDYTRSVIRDEVYLPSESSSPFSTFVPQNGGSSTVCPTKIENQRKRKWSCTTNSEVKEPKLKNPRRRSEITSCCKLLRLFCHCEESKDNVSEMQDTNSRSSTLKGEKISHIAIPHRRLKEDSNFEVNTSNDWIGESSEEEKNLNIFESLSRIDSSINEIAKKNKVNSVVENTCRKDWETLSKIFIKKEKFEKIDKCSSTNEGVKAVKQQNHINSQRKEKSKRKDEVVSAGNEPGQPSQILLRKGRSQKKEEFSSTYQSEELSQIVVQIKSKSKMKDEFSSAIEKQSQIDIKNRRKSGKNSEFSSANECEKSEEQSQTDIKNRRKSRRKTEFSSANECEKSEEQSQIYIKNRRRSRMKTEFSSAIECEASEEQSQIDIKNERKSRRKTEFSSVNECEASQEQSQIDIKNRRRSRRKTKFSSANECETSDKQSQIDIKNRRKSGKNSEFSSANECEKSEEQSHTDIKNGRKSRRKTEFSSANECEKSEEQSQIDFKNRRRYRMKTEFSSAGECEASEERSQIDIKNGRKSRRKTEFSRSNECEASDKQSQIDIKNGRKSRRKTEFSSVNECEASEEQSRIDIENRRRSRMKTEFSSANECEASEERSQIDIKNGRKSRRKTEFSRSNECEASDKQSQIDIKNGRKSRRKTVFSSVNECEASEEQSRIDIENRRRSRMKTEFSSANECEASEERSQIDIKNGRKSRRKTEFSRSNECEASDKQSQIDIKNGRKSRRKTEFSSVNECEASEEQSRIDIENRRRSRMKTEFSSANECEASEERSQIDIKNGRKSRRKTEFSRSNECEASDKQSQIDIKNRRKSGKNSEFSSVNECEESEERNQIDIKNRRKTEFLSVNECEEFEQEKRMVVRIKMKPKKENVFSSIDVCDISEEQSQIDINNQTANELEAFHCGVNGNHDQEQFMIEDGEKLDLLSRDSTQTKILDQLCQNDDPQIQMFDEKSRSESQGLLSKEFEQLSQRSPHVDDNSGNELNMLISSGRVVSYVVSSPILFTTPAMTMEEYQDYLKLNEEIDAEIAELVTRSRPQDVIDLARACDIPDTVVISDSEAETENEVALGQTTADVVIEMETMSENMNSLFVEPCCNVKEMESVCIWESVLNPEDTRRDLSTSLENSLDSIGAHDDIQENPNESDASYSERDFVIPGEGDGDDSLPLKGLQESENSETHILESFDAKFRNIMTSDVGMSEIDLEPEVETNRQEIFIKRNIDEQRNKPETNLTRDGESSKSFSSNMWCHEEIVKSEGVAKISKESNEPPVCSLSKKPVVNKSVSNSFWIQANHRSSRQLDWKEEDLKKILRESVLGLRSRPSQVQRFQAGGDGSANKESKKSMKSPARTSDSDTPANKLTCEAKMTSFSFFSSKTALKTKCSPTAAVAPLGTPSAVADPTSSELPATFSENQHKSLAAKPPASNNTFKIGDIVWARFGYVKYWPAVIIDPTSCGQKPTPPNRFWVFWFGDHKISEVLVDRILEFTKNFSAKHIPSWTRQTYQSAIIEALKEVARNIGMGQYTSDQELQIWALGGFKVEDQDQQSVVGPVISPWVSEKLIRLKKCFEVESSDDLDLADDDSETTSEERTDKRKSDADVVELRDLVSSGKVAIEDVCLSCRNVRQSCDYKHPFFNGGLCSGCRKILTDSIFIFGADGTNVYCIICGQGGDLFVCEVEGCNKVYCTLCIKELVGKDAPTVVFETNPWSCYLCSNKTSAATSGVLKAREDWRDGLNRIFQFENFVKEPTLTNLPRRPIRVLSLFDGIGTGKFALDQLGIVVETYFSCEIDRDSMIVTKMRHGDSVTFIGSVTDLSCVELKKLCPIDLLIGGSPCNDFSIANPGRQGLEGSSGQLFYEFYFVLEKLLKLNGSGTHLYWLFENVASMNSDCKEKMSKFFACRPALWDAKYLSAQKRARLFWGNIPGMFCPVQYTHAPKLSSLSEHLFPMRNAKVQKIRTVTTKPNSLMQQDGGDSIYPVEMDNVGDTVWIPELERIFGFPEHYTDVANIPPSRRQKLLGQAWSVHVVKHLLNPLKKFFKTTEEDVQTADDSVLPDESVLP